MSLCWLFWVNFFSHLVSFFNIKNESLILLQKSFLGLCHYLFCSIAFIFSLGFFFRAILYISSILFSFKSFSLFLLFSFLFSTSLIVFSAVSILLVHLPISSSFPYDDLVILLLIYSLFLLFVFLIYHVLSFNYFIKFYLVYG